MQKVLFMDRLPALQLPINHKLCFTLTLRCGVGRMSLNDMRRIAGLGHCGVLCLGCVHLARKENSLC